jgi:hypothetical protein
VSSVPDGSFRLNGSAFSYSVCDALQRATVVVSQWEHVETVLVQFRHHAVGREAVGDGGCAAFENLGHVPDHRRENPSSKGKAAKIEVSLLRPATRTCAPDSTASWIGSTPIIATMCDAASTSA